MSIQSLTSRITIIGGGPAGTSCAIELSNLGVKDVLLIESGDYSKFCIGESIPPESKPVLKHLGIYGAFRKEGHDPCYGSCSYWGSDKRGYNDTLLSHHGHGWHLDRRRFNRFLAEQAEERGTVVMKNTSFLEAKKLDIGKFVLTCENENNETLHITSDFIIDASGSRGVFASKQGSQKNTTEPLICLAARFKLSSDSKVSKLTHIEAQEYGWWYAARLPDDTLLIGLYTDGETVIKKKIQAFDRWLSLLKETPTTIEFINDAEIIDEKFKGYPAPSFCLDKAFGDNWVAIGDVASAYDPVTSRGIIKSLTDGLFAAEKIQQHLTGDETALPEFEKMVQANFQNYLRTRQHFYQLEQRWPVSPFWRKYQLDEMNVDKLDA